MLSFRKALTAAAFVLTILYLLSHNTHHVSSNSHIPSPNLGTDGKEESGTAAAAPPPPATQDESQSNKGHVPSTPVSTSSSAKAPAGGLKQPAQQRPIMDTANLPLIDQLAYQFPYDGESKFPAYIWQTWKYTPASGEFSEDLRPAEASWSEKHPGFVHEVITDQVAVHLMRHLYASMPDVLEAYNSLPLPILKADFFRYLILLARGGIYTDIDTWALQSALDWIPPNVPRNAVGLVIGIEADPDRPDWHEWYSRRIQFCQWTIEAKPGHPVLREIVANITQETLKRKKAGTLKVTDDNVVEFTGPAIWTDIIFDFFNSDKYFDMTASNGNITWRDFTGMTAAKKVGDVVVLPITSFSPGVKQMGAEEDDHPMAFVKHEFGGTWKPEYLRHIGEEQQEEEEEEKKREEERKKRQEEKRKRLEERKKKQEAEEQKNKEVEATKIEENQVEKEVEEEKTERKVKATTKPVGTSRVQ
ncbi:MAG: membrane-bound alpha-1,6- mannosyltransferase Initiation-specific [Claussenomyces sp. TS43310]|nr:MAG: membrane-bound alpha-1,6- mannosyltransferase Initiation-specific [Claussenomyces sp. TS43310]